MKTQGVSQRPQQPPQVAIQPSLTEELRTRTRRNYDTAMKKHFEEEALSLIALAHMPVEEAAAQLLAKHSVSAEEFRIFYEKVGSIVEDARDETTSHEEEMSHALDAQEEAEGDAQSLREDLADLKKKAEVLANAVLESR